MFGGSFEDTFVRLGQSRRNVRLMRRSTNFSMQWEGGEVAGAVKAARNSLSVEQLGVDSTL